MKLMFGHAVAHSPFSSLRALNCLRRCWACTGFLKVMNTGMMIFGWHTEVSCFKRTAVEGKLLQDLTLNLPVEYLHGFHDLGTHRPQKSITLWVLHQAEV